MARRTAGHPPHGVGVRPRPRLAIASLFLALAAACACVPVEDGSIELPVAPRRPLPACEWAEVVSVTDGDTVRIDLDGTEERLRYIGIDAPELNPQSGDPEPFAGEATEANETLVGGKRICLERDVSDRDRFDRLLRYAWLENGTMVNEALVLAGLAEAVEFRPDTKHHDAILFPAQDEAMAAGRGIWQ